MFKSLSTLGLSFFFVAVAFGQPQRAFVSGNGLDANDCTLPSPCRTFDRAITVVAAGGEVVALTSAGYGPFTINKSVTVVSPAGVHAAVTALAGDAITLNVAGAGSVVILRGLTISGIGGGNGITGTPPDDLYVENCVITNFNSRGLLVSSTNRPIALHAANDAFRQMFQEAIALYATPGFPVRAVIDRCAFDHNAISGTTGAVLVTDYTLAAIRDSEASGNFRAFQALSSGNGSEMFIERCIVAHNAIGVYGGGGATVYVADSTLTENSTFAIQGPAQTSAVLSNGHNNVVGNTGGENFTGTFSQK